MSQNQTALWDTLRDNTSRILKELELQTPMYFQICSDMYREYLHTLDAIFGMYMTAERKFAERMNTDQAVADRLGSIAEGVTNNWLDQIGAYGEFLQQYTQIRSSGARAHGRLLRAVIAAYIQAMERTAERMDISGWRDVEAR